MEGTPQAPSGTGGESYIAVDIDHSTNPPMPSARIADDANAEWIGRGIAAILIEATNRGLDAVQIQSAMMQGFQAATQ